MPNDQDSTHTAGKHMKTAGSEVTDAQRDEADSTGVTPTFPALPSPMGRGLLGGIVIGAVIGAIVLAPLSLFSMGSLSWPARLAIVALIGAVAGSAAGAVFFGGATAEVEDDEPATGDPSVVPKPIRHDDPPRSQD